MLEKYFKTKGPAGFHSKTRMPNGITFLFINCTFFGIWIQLKKIGPAELFIYCDQMMT